MQRLLPPSLLLALLACAKAAPGTRPHDMSEAQHEVMARREDKKADDHLAAYEPDASVQKQRCGAGGAQKAGADIGGCYVWRVNPTAEALVQAKEHQKMAAQHRAGSQALRDAEGRACVGVFEEDRDNSPFDHAGDIASVVPLESRPAIGTAKTEGAVVTFRSLNGITSEGLQRIVDCHLARNAALGNNVPEMPNCPLVPKDITARVSGNATGFAVTIRASDPRTAQEVLRRANTLSTAQ
jgi:hypothetical protein